jgi:adenosylmethionine-8-amino-7-oxononanoate aminotransferase
MGGTVGVRAGNHVLLAPPFICMSQQIETLVERRTGAIDACSR